MYFSLELIMKFSIILILTPIFFAFQTNSWSSPSYKPTVYSPIKLNKCLCIIKDWSPNGRPRYLVLKFAPFEFNLNFIKNEYFNFFNTILIGFMMISKIPTLSLKKININQKYKTWIILLFVFISVALVSKIWLTLIFAFGLYIVSIFFTIFKNREIKP